jgi:serine/threonine-protein kinase
MAVDTAEDFFAVLEKSGLLGDEQLSDSRLAAGQDNDPKAVARALAQKGLVTRWQAGQLLAGRSSFFLGKYKLVEPIGRGGMGSVFLAEHITMNRLVALKILPRPLGKDPASVERFLDEARAVAALDHPNIVRAYSVDHDADRYYLVMEYIDGRDLKQLVEREGLPDYHSAADYIRQAADGLAHGHGRNMIHCDIKPSNLLVSQQGQVKIVDLGITRLGGRPQEEINGQGERVLGSVDYLAPEQAMESHDFDHRADIYSLGCTLYFLLTGHPPFPEGTLTERIVKHQMQQPPSILRERRDAPTGLVKICEKMMAKRPQDRFQSAEEVSRVLAEWQLREPHRTRIVPLKTAQPLGEPAGGRLPTIDVDAEPRPGGGRVSHPRIPPTAPPRGGNPEDRP